MISILYIGQEYLNASLRNSLLAVPRRMNILYSKVFVLLSITFGIWLMTVALSLLLVRIYYQQALSSSLLSLVCCSGLLLVSLIFICISLVIISRSMLVSTALLLSLLLGLGQILLQFSPFVSYCPLIATLNLFFAQENPLFLPVFEGVIVQFLWSILLINVAGWIFCNRSVQ